jgi:hypothetical protein
MRGSKPSHRTLSPCAGERRGGRWCNMAQQGHASRPPPPSSKAEGRSSRRQRTLSFGRRWTPGRHRKAAPLHAAFPLPCGAAGHLRRPVRAGRAPPRKNVQPAAGQPLASQTEFRAGVPHRRNPKNSLLNSLLSGNRPLRWRCLVDPLPCAARRTQASWGRRVGKGGRGVTRYARRNPAFAHAVRPCRITCGGQRGQKAGLSP